MSGLVLSALLLGAGQTKGTNLMFHPKLGEEMSYTRDVSIVVDLPSKRRFEARGRERAIEIATEFRREGCLLRVALKRSPWEISGSIDVPDEAAFYLPFLLGDGTQDQEILVAPQGERSSVRNDMAESSVQFSAESALRFLPSPVALGGEWETSLQQNSFAARFTLVSEVRVRGQRIALIAVRPAKEAVRDPSLPIDLSPPVPHGVWAVRIDDGVTLRYDLSLFIQSTGSATIRATSVLDGAPMWSQMSSAPWRAALKSLEADSEGRFRLGA